MIKFLLTLVVIHSITSSPQHQICRFCGSLICKHHGLLTAGSSKAHIWLQAGHTCIVFVCKVCGPIRGLKVHGEVLTLRLDTKKICVMTSLGYICSNIHMSFYCQLWTRLGRRMLSRKEWRFFTFYMQHVLHQMELQFQILK